MREIEIKVKARVWSESAIRALQAIGLEISAIKDVTRSHITVAARARNGASSYSLASLGICKFIYGSLHRTSHSH